MKTHPALDIHFTAEAEPSFDVRDLVVAGLDDFQPTAIEESPVSWRVFFASPSSREAAAAWLRGLGEPRVKVSALDVDDEDWARRSQMDLQPIRIGRIVVTPPWCADAARQQAEAGDVVLVVVPSTGFGTGHHASTRLCLALLQQLEVRGRSVLDVGTGSGVLAIAAARLGARGVQAVDNDPDAVDAARENVALNPPAAPIRLECADFHVLAPERADLVLANLTGELLRRSAADLARRTARGGSLIVSGVLAEERESVVAAFQSAGVSLVATLTEEEWVGLRFAN